MAEVIWTRRALADVEALGAYAAETSPRYAAHLVRRLLAATERLSAFPLSGRAVPEMQDADVREVLHRNFRIVYLFDAAENRVEVLTVFHASRAFGP